MNFPSRHELHLGYNQSGTTNASVAGADVILVIDADVPWYPAREAVRRREDHPSRHRSVLLALPHAQLPLRRAHRGQSGHRASDAGRGGTASRRARHVAERRERVAAEHPPTAGVRRGRGGAGVEIDHRVRLGDALPGGASTRHDRGERVSARSPVCGVHASGQLSRLAPLQRARLRLRRRARGEAGLAGVDGHRDARGRRLLLRAAHVLPLRAAGAQSSPPHDHLQQSEMGGGEERGQGLPRRAGQEHRPVPAHVLTPSPRFEEIVKAFDGHGERVERRARSVPR